MSFFIGVLISFIGSINPGILTLTTLKIGIQKGKNAGSLFSLGISLIIALQAYISLEFASLIKENPFVERNIQIIGCVIFFILSFYFFSLGNGKKQKELDPKKSTKSPFWQGVILSLLNVFSVIFYAGIGLTLNYGDFLHFNTIDMVSFSMGSGIGSLAFLLIIVRTAKFIDSKIALLSNNINYILGIVTGLVALFTVSTLI